MPCVISVVKNLRVSVSLWFKTVSSKQGAVSGEQ